MQQMPRPDPNKVRARVLSEIMRSNGTTFNELMRRTPVNDQTLENCLEDLVKSSDITMSNGSIFKTKSGENYLYASEECGNCQGRGVTVRAGMESRYATYQKVCKSAPMYSYTLNQRPVTLDTSWHRALYAIRPGAEAPDRTIILGDDDLTSIALALLAPKMEVIVLEADERLVNFVNTTAAAFGLDHLSAVTYNAREPVPGDLRGTADLSICDPSSTLFDLFLSRCTDLCRRNGRGQIMTFAYPTYLSHGLDLQEHITRMGLMIQALIPGFNRYRLYDVDIPETRPHVPRNGETHETIAFVEALMLLQVMEMSQPLVVGACDASDQVLYGEKAMQRLKDPEADPSIHQEQRDLVK